MTEDLNQCQIGECPSGNPHCEGCAPDHPIFVIWWLSQADCETLAAILAHETIGNVTVDWPEWLFPQVSSRFGRPGRGRLWNAFPGEWLKGGIEPWPDTALGRHLGGQAGDRGAAGGIVLPLEYLSLVIGLPGLVTNDRLDRLCVNGVDVDL